MLVAKMRLSALRRVPFFVRSTVLSSGASIGWRGQGKARKVSALGFDALVLEPLQVSGTVVVSKGWYATKRGVRGCGAESSSGRHSDDTRHQLPRSGVDRHSRCATSIDHRRGHAGRRDVGDHQERRRRVGRAFAGELATGYFIARPALTVLLSGADNPQVTARGGTLAGLPLLTSSALPTIDAGHSPLVLVDAGGIAVAQDPAFAFSIAESATLQLDDAPTNDSVTPTPLISLFQGNLVALAIDDQLAGRARWLGRHAFGAA